MKKKREWLWEFSKKIVVAVAVAFFIAVVYAMIHQWVYPESMVTENLLNNMTDVFKATVVVYGVKAGFENVWKIAKNRPKNDDCGTDNDTDY